MYNMTSHCYILTLDRAVNQRCTWVNKRKNITWSNRKWALWYNICRLPWHSSQLETVKARVRASLQSVKASRWGLLLLVERPPIVGVVDSEGQSESKLAVSKNAPLAAVALSGLWLGNPVQEAEEVQSGSWR